MKRATALFLLVIPFISAAQVNTDKDKIVGTTYPQKGTPVVCGGRANMQTLDLNWRPILEKKVTEVEHPVPEGQAFEDMKARKTEMKFSAEKSKHNGAEKTSSVTPVVGPNFAGNTHNGMTPMDNNIAIANNGNIVSVANHSIVYYDESGTNLYFRDIVSFLPSSFGVTAVCDPVVTYDPRADRFIFFCQEYSTSFTLFGNNRIFICFSQSNNPYADGFVCYAITGDATGAGDAFDYPKIAVTDSELYISGNLFYEPANTFHQAILFQMYKYPGYAGGTLNYLYYSNIPGGPFTVLPVAEGHGGSYGPGIYAVASHSSMGSDVNLYKTTANACCGPVINQWNVSTTSYSASGDAAQSGTSCQLNTGDCRALSGFYLNGLIHFVFNCDGGSGYTYINYNRLNTSSHTNTSSTFGLSGYDYCYPSVASFATSASDKSVIINFGRSGSSIYPEVRAVNCDDAMGWSGSTLVKSSASYIGCGTGSTTRWGDYTGVSRRHNTFWPSVWLNGMFGDAGGSWDTWIAEIHPPGVGAANVSVADVKAKVYPNPVYENFNVEFSLNERAPLNISIVDMTGRLVKELYQGEATAGENVFSFNKANLANGTYVLRITSNSKMIKDEKIVVAH